MSEEPKDPTMEMDEENREEYSDILESEERSGKYDKLIQDGENKYKLSGMFKNWFLDYASYVILDRAVPHIADGLKPVQRRILHAMKRVDDGRFNKVANIIGQTMQFHPHGDAAIGDALVQLGQKNLLIDCQGNWGNHRRQGCSSPIYRGALEQVCAGGALQPKDHRVDELLRRQA